MPIKKNQNKFIEDASIFHNNKYNYKNIKYEDNKSLLEIECPYHGPFLQIADVHLKHGCSKCSNNYKPSNEEIIKEFNLIHNNYYNYELLNYESTDIKIKIKCPVHDIFTITPRLHKAGSGCNKCAKIKRANAFFNAAHKIFNNKYIYNEDDFVSIKKHCKIKCPIHGFFTVYGKNHLTGSGCKKCKSEERLNNKKELFIKESKVIHEDIYEYNLVNYINSIIKVKIKCKKHGYFEQTPSAHKSGSGCQLCINDTLLTRKEQITILNKANDNKYNYSKMKHYTNAKDKLKIICKKHGEFFQSYNHHKKGAGCPKCGNNTLIEKDFIKEANKIHSSKYNYSIVKIILMTKRVDILCPVHHIFKQTPSAHLNGSGCPECSNGGFCSTKPAIFYYLKIFHENKYYYKIGITNRTIKKRYSLTDMKKITILMENHYKLGGEALRLETQLKRSYKKDRYIGKPILKSGNSEIFVKDIMQLDLKVN